MTEQTVLRPVTEKDLAGTHDLQPGEFTVTAAQRVRNVTTLDWVPEPIGEPSGPAQLAAINSDQIEVLDADLIGWGDYNTTIRVEDPNIFEDPNTWEWEDYLARVLIPDSARSGEMTEQTEQIEQIEHTNPDYGMGDREAFDRPGSLAEDDARFARYLPPSGLRNPTHIWLVEAPSATTGLPDLAAMGVGFEVATSHRAIIVATLPVVERLEAAGLRVQLAPAGQYEGDTEGSVTVTDSGELEYSAR